MNRTRSTARSLLAAFLVTALSLTALGGCGGSTSDSANEMTFVYVNWAEGIAMTHLLHNVLEDSMGMDVELSRVNGGGLAFSAVAAGNADIFVEAWLPTTHKSPWEQNQDQLQKLGYTFRGTSVGLAVPTYVDIDSIGDLPSLRDELDGQIHGIEAGAQINGQTRQILENNGIEGFEVVASSGPATWQLLERRIDNREPIVVTGWKPHWKWTEFDLKYIDGAKTGDTPVFGAPEAIFTLVGNDFVDRYPERVVCFLKEFEVTYDQMYSLMQDFRGREGRSETEAADEWIQAHPEAVRGWLEQAQTCAAAEGHPQPLPDSATYRPDSTAMVTASAAAR